MAIPPTKMHETGCKSYSPRFRCDFLLRHSCRAAVSFSRVRVLANPILINFCFRSYTTRPPLFQSGAANKYPLAQSFLIRMENISGLTIRDDLVYAMCRLLRISLLYSRREKIRAHFTNLLSLVASSST